MNHFPLSVLFIRRIGDQEFSPEETTADSLATGDLLYNTTATSRYISHVFVPLCVCKNCAQVGGDHFDGIVLVCASISLPRATSESVLCPKVRIIIRGGVDIRQVIIGQVYPHIISPLARG